MSVPELKKYGNKNLSGMFWSDFYDLLDLYAVISGYSDAILPDGYNDYISCTSSISNDIDKRLLESIFIRFNNKYSGMSIAISGESDEYTNSCGLLCEKIAEWLDSEKISTVDCSELSNQIIAILRTYFHDDLLALLSADFIRKLSEETGYNLGRLVSCIIGYGRKIDERVV